MKTSFSNHTKLILEEYNSYLFQFKQKTTRGFCKFFISYSSPLHEIGQPRRQKICTKSFQWCIKIKFNVSVRKSAKSHFLLGFQSLTEAHCSGRVHCSIKLQCSFKIFGIWSEVMLVWRINIYQSAWSWSSMNKNYIDVNPEWPNSFQRCAVARTIVGLKVYKCLWTHALQVHVDPKGSVAILTSKQPAGVTPEVNVSITQVRKHTSEPPWPWNPAKSVAQQKGLVYSENLNKRRMHWTRSTTGIFVLLNRHDTTLDDII